MPTRAWVPLLKVREPGLARPLPRAPTGWSWQGSSLDLRGGGWGGVAATGLAVPGCALAPSWLCSGTHPGLGPPTAAWPGSAQRERADCWQGQSSARPQVGLCCHVQVPLVSQNLLAPSHWATQGGAQGCRLK